MTLTRTQELAMLGDSRRIAERIANLTADELGAFAANWRARAPIAWADQHDAAIAETASTIGLWLAIPDYRQRPDTTVRTNDRAQIMAAITRCLASHHCPHAVYADRPLTALVAHRVITCARCSPQFAAVMLKRDALQAAAADTECDLCLTRGVTEFHPFAILMGPVTLIGDMCPDCWGQRQPEVDP
jgi:hypothetical protein